jgi:hypothetical protein
MMDLKPVFTMEQEESASQDEGGGLSFDPEAGEAEEIQSELDNLDEIGLEDGVIVDQEVEFVADAQAESLQQEAPPLGEAPAEPALEAGDELPPLVPEEPTLEAGDELPPLEPEIVDEPETAEIPPIEEPVVGEDSSSMFQEDAGSEDEVLLSEFQDDELPPDSLEEDVMLDDLPTPEGEEDDEDFFREEYLGDEEIDEEQIISAEDELEATEQPDLSQEDEKELDQMLTEDKELDDLGDIAQQEVLATGEIEEEEEEEIELDQEEEELIQASIEADLEAEVEAGEVPADALEELPPELAVDAAEEPLFERNFNALEEEGPAEIFGEAPGETAEEESWELKETETGLALPAEDGDTVDGEKVAEDLEPAPSFEGEEEFITLGKPIGDDLEEPSLTGGGEDGEEDEEEEEEEEEKTWSPDSPPGFVPKPGEDFPKESIKDPPLGDHRDPEEGEPSPMPRHVPEEVLEDPESLGPVLDEDSETALEFSAEIGGVEEETLDEELSAGGPDDADTAPAGEEIEEAFEPLETTASEEEGVDGLAATLGANRHEDAPAAEAEPGESAGDEQVVAEFDNLFSSLQDEIAANPEGERIDDILRSEGIRDMVAELKFDLPQDENPSARAQGLYALPGDGEEPSAFPSALQGSGAPPSEAGDEPYPEIPPLEKPESTSALSLLDEDIRAKLGQVLDEIISISVRKAVREEMPKIVERIAREN